MPRKPNVALEHPDAQVAEDSIRTLLRFIGEDITREGLIETPARVVRAWFEQSLGYTQDPADILKKDFDGDGYNEMIAVPNIEFFSNCEHHMLPFFGVAHLAYIPEKRVVGLSKLARLVDCFAKRLQIQEKMTKEIACAMNEHLHPKGVAVVIHARHFCMACRGVRKQKASMVTSALCGCFHTDESARAEFFSLINQKGESQ